MTLAETLKEIRPLDRSIESVAQERLDFSDQATGKSRRVRRASAPDRGYSGQSSAEARAQNAFCFCRRPRHHTRRRERLSQRSHGANDVQLPSRWRRNQRFRAPSRRRDRRSWMSASIMTSPDPCGLRHHKIRRGTANFTHGPAMTHDEAERALELGFSSPAKSPGKMSLF